MSQRYSPSKGRLTKKLHEVSVAEGWIRWTVDGWKHSDPYFFLLQHCIINDCLPYFIHKSIWNHYILLRYIRIKKKVKLFCRFLDFEITLCFLKNWASWFFHRSSKQKKKKLGVDIFLGHDILNCARHIVFLGKQHISMKFRPLILYTFLCYK